jgi:CheY-like chemotaxis protein
LFLRRDMSCVSIVVADGCPVFLCGLISVLSSEHDFDVVARCCNGFESLKAIRDLSPDIALLDSSTPIASGVNVLASAISEGSHTRIVLLAAPAELQAIFAVASGAYGSQSSPAQHFFKACNRKPNCTHRVGRFRSVHSTSRSPINAICERSVARLSASSLLARCSPCAHFGLALRGGWHVY